MSSQSCMASLPVELIVRILKKAGLRNLLRCQKVCRGWYELIRDTAELQHVIELELHDVQDNCPAQMSIDQRLQLLRQMQSAWRKLGIAKPLLLCSTAMNFVPCIGKFEFANEAISHGRGEFEYKIFLKRVCAGVSGVEEAGYLTMPQHTSLSDYCMDPQQDIGVLATIHPTNLHSLHIRSLTTGQGHPLASVEDIPLNIQFNCDVFLTMGADFVLAKYWMSDGDGPGSREKIYYKLYNWKTGALHMMVHSPYILTLLSGTHAFLGCRRASRGSFALLMADISAPSTRTITEMDSERICALVLPPFYNGELVTTIAPRIPVSTLKAGGTFSSAPANNRAYTSLFPLNEDSDRLIIVEWSRQVPITAAIRVSYSHVRFLVSSVRLRQKFEEHPQGSAEREIPWAEWRDCIVWATLLPATHHSPRIVAGMRVADHRPMQHPDGRCTFRVMDFNPLRVARAARDGLRPGESIVPSSCIPVGPGISEELVVNHPYLVQEVEFPAEAVDSTTNLWLRITEEGLFLINMDGRTDVYGFPIQ